MTFNALLATKDGEKIWTNVVELDERDLMSSDVIIAVDYSTVNYKDGVHLRVARRLSRDFREMP